MSEEDIVLLVRDTLCEMDFRDVSRRLIKGYEVQLNSKTNLVMTKKEFTAFVEAMSKSEDQSIGFRPIYDFDAALLAVIDGLDQISKACSFMSL